MLMRERLRKGKAERASREALYRAEILECRIEGGGIDQGGDDAP